MFNNRNKMISTPPYKPGFTLAETLITIVVVGIVAAVILPVMIQHYRRQVIINQLKKSYSILGQAINMAVKDYGNTDKWELQNSLSTVQGHIEYADKYIAPYLKVMKKSGGVSGWWNCTPNKQFPGLYCVSTTSKKGNYSGWVPYIFYLQDGSAVTVGGWNSRVITVDVNGIKKPNVAGYDVFTFSISNNKLSAPQWKSADTWSCSKDSTHSYNGWACASRIIKNNWDFPDDYPLKL